jgi:hypothetical protein
MKPSKPASPVNGARAKMVDVKAERKSSAPKKKVPQRDGLAKFAKELNGRFR